MKKFICNFIGIFVLGFMFPAFVYAKTIVPGKGTKTPPPTCETAVKTAAQLKYAGHTPKSRTGTNDWATAVYQDTTPTDKYGDVETYIEYLLTQICNSQKPVNDAKKGNTKANQISTAATDVGSQITFTEDDKKNSDISKAIDAWKKKCTNTCGDFPVDECYAKETQKKKNITLTCLISKCVTEDGENLTVSPDGKSCLTHGGECVSPDKHAKKTSYDTKTNKCNIVECQQDYGVQDNKCVKQKKIDRQETRANNKLEKEYAADIKSLVDAFNTVVTKISSRCEADGGTIVDGKCVSDNESGNKNNAVSGDYTLFTPPADNAVDKICKYERNKYLGSKNWEVRPNECNFSKKANCPQSLETNESDQCTENQLKNITKEKCEECLDLFKKNKRCYKEATDWCNKNGAKHN